MPYIMLRAPAVLAALMVLAAGRGAAQGNLQQLWNSGWDNWTTVPSYVYGGPTVDAEAADDFDVTGTISRVIFNGYDCFNCATPVVLGAYVRFYAGSGGAIGALQSEQFVAAGSSGLVFNAAQPATFDITLPSPFAATGRHFVSVQVAFQGPGYWAVWSAHNNNPTFSALRVRDRLLGGPWTGYAPLTGWPATNADLSFELWGPAAPPPPSTDPAANWQVLATPNLAGDPRCWLRDLKVLALDDVWAVGDALVPVPGGNDNVAVAMRWTGAQWNLVPIPSPPPAPSSPPGGTYVSLNALDGTGPNDLWAAGQQRIQVAGGWVGGQVLIEHWDGQAWTVMPGTPLPATSIGAGVSGASVSDIVAIAPNDAWFAGFWIELFPNSTTSRPGLLTHWDGSGFTQYNVPLVATGAQHTFSAIDASGPNDVWAVGSASGSVGAATVPLVFHWNGTSWTHRPPPTNGQRVTYFDVVVNDPQNVWIQGYYSTATSSSPPFLLYWNGSTWTQLPGATNYGQLQVFATNLIYCVRNDVQRFDGTAWTTVASFPAISSAQGLAVDSFGLHEMWTVGGEWAGGVPRPFSARVDAPRYAKTTAHEGCTSYGTPATLQSLGLPRPGSMYSVSISDPAGYLGAPGGTGSTWWFLSLQPAPGAPCGLLTAGGGGLGAPGEVMIAPSGIFAAPGPVPLPGPGASAVHTVAIPPQPALAGATVFTQGVIVDPTNASRLVLTNGLEVRIGY